MGFRLAGIGSYAPPQVVTNADLARLGCDPQWIVERSGIRERRHAPPEMATSDLAAAAGRAAVSPPLVLFSGVPMGSLVTVVSDPARRRLVIEDCVALLEAE
ncbi:MAG: 3-oxoacyl-ACP synthase, partial [Planctomycetia bacterium]